MLLAFIIKESYYFSPDIKKDIAREQINIEKFNIVAYPCATQNLKVY